MKDLHPTADQFNSIHEKLIDAWKHYGTVMNGNMVYFSSLDNIEDFMTVSYLQDTAVQAGLDGGTSNAKTSAGMHSAASSPIWTKIRSITFSSSIHGNGF